MASTGGHLEQLRRLAPRLDVEGSPLWVTFDTPQSRSLLEGERVHFVPYVPPRSPLALAATVPDFVRLFRSHAVTGVVSTGAAVAGAALPVAAAFGVPSAYIESAARTASPSMTGRLVSRVPRVSTFAQYEQWSGGRWAYAGSVLEGFGVSAAADPPERPTLLVAMGTLAFPFPRLVDAVTRVTPDDWNLLWQTGPVEYAGLRGTVVGAASDREFKSLCQQADVIVGHAGVGTALASLSSGRMPVLVPRAKACGEHVDDHQRFIARELSSRGLAVEAAAETLSVADLHRALASAVHQIDPEALPRLRVLPTRAPK